MKDSKVKAHGWWMGRFANRPVQDCGNIVSLSGVIYQFTYSPIHLFTIKPAIIYIFAKMIGVISYI